MMLEELPEPEHVELNYGYSVLGVTQHRKMGRIWISGLEWEQGRLSLILPGRGPRRRGDYIPVWRTPEEAARVMTTFDRTEAHVERFHVASVQDTVEGGGPQKIDNLSRGVDGFTVPAKPASLYKRNWRPSPQPPVPANVPAPLESV